MGPMAAPLVQNQQDQHKGLMLFTPAHPQAYAPPPLDKLPESHKSQRKLEVSKKWRGQGRRDGTKLWDCKSGFHEFMAPSWSVNASQQGGVNKWVCGSLFQ